MVANNLDKLYLAVIIFYFFWQDVDFNKPSSTKVKGERLSYQEPSCSYYNKRSVQDVFGDIDDIDFESSELGKRTPFKRTIPIASILFSLLY